MTTSTKKSRPHRLRKLGHTPLIVAVAAGVVCTAAGTSTADAAITSQNEPEYTWTLTNRTGQPIYGTWSAEMSTGNGSHVEATEDRPWELDATVTTTQYQNARLSTTWKSHICYNKHW
ncbi:hypothetical protein R3Q06_32430 [Rhodococcus erythropolis]|uniref:hypothetical protein n=1 Tax=Rhodococcus erythropolis TaxID=1833 RepID=UPI002948ECE9|nr:hypothetical protein [Rhodococcus erythropolis]MDV6278176.1 hypothetical protein [Rhodococcus erythropolis]